MMESDLGKKYHWINENMLNMWENVYALQEINFCRDENVGHKDQRKKWCNFWIHKIRLQSKSIDKSLHRSIEPIPVNA